ncbi:sensor histidine kinase [Streptomyces sp. NPDC059698]|uniref:sensor histidine kinase n=1 Tax=unclassified Streptomyces TaxID=2593676 RepID=UPI0009A129D9|nr:histidine kinase [Streptomyces sp. CB02366]
MQVGRGRIRVDPLVIDSLLGCVMAVVTVTYGRQAYTAQYQGEGWPSFGVLAIALSLAVNLPLVLRERAPWVAFGISCGALAVYTAADFQPSTNLWAPLLACYTVIVRSPARRAAWAAAATAAAWAAAGLAARLSAELSLTQAALGVGVVWAWATGSRRLAQRNVQLAELTAQLRREQELRAQHAIAQERLRIARELHDVVAHHLSALAVQAGLAEYVFASDPAAARQAVVSVGSSSRQALEEMRGLLGVLRTGAESPDEENLYRSAPGLEALDDLVRRTRASGLDVTWSVSGQRRPLPSGVDLCAYRIVQEALTNSVKHAGPGARVSISLGFGSDLLTCEVTSRGGAAPAAELPSTGLGLIGMRERARLYGGSLRAGPRAEGGFEVVFTVPLVPLDTAGGA